MADRPISQNEPPHTLFDSEERTLTAAQTMLDRLVTTGEGVRRLAEAYAKSYQEQKKLISLSDRMQLELHEANQALAKQAAELAALNQTLQDEAAQREQLTEQLRRLAAEDSLTGAATRRQFFALAEQAFKQQARGSGPLSVLVADLDDFKGINDQFGHAVGDQALKAFTDICQSQLRPTDILGRLGGEEFAIVLLEADEAAACRVAERIRLLTLEKLAAQARCPRRITVSIGLAGQRGTADTLEAMLARADRAAYAAKYGGRNRVESAEMDSAQSPGGSRDGGR